MNVNDVKYGGRIKTLEAQVRSLQAKLREGKVKIDVGKEILRQANQSLSKDIKKLLVERKKQEDYVAQVCSAVTELEELPRVEWKVPKAVEKRTPMAAVLHLTDWHIGEVIEPSETENWGSFNWEIAQDRVLGQLLPSFKLWLDAQRNAYNIDEIVLVETGDFVSGDIHDELRRTNEFPLPVQTAKAGQLLAAVGRELATNCNQLTVVQIGADNHSRLVQKPQMKQKTLNSMSYLVYEIQQTMMNGLSNVTFDRATGMKHTFKVRNTVFLGEHGDTVKSWMGVPWYGMERERAREATRRMFTDRGFHHMIMGHWHKDWFGDIIVGGSLSGTSEYDHGCGRSASPRQTSFLVGKKGPFGFVPFILQ